MFKNAHDMKSYQDESSSHHHEIQDAPDKPPVGFIALIILLSFGFVFLVWIISYPFLDKMSSDRKDSVVAGMGNPIRLNYLKQQDEILSTYKDLGNGRYQIPISNAMEKVVRKQGDVF